MDMQALQRLIQEVVSTIVNTNKRVLIVHPQTTISNRQVETLKSYFQVEEWQADTPSQMFHDATVFLEVDQSFIVSSAQGLPHSPASLFLTELLLKDEPAILVPNEKNVCRFYYERTKCLHENASTAYEKLTGIRL